MGSLEALAGSHRSGVLPARSAYGAGGLGVDTDHLGLVWRGGDFACGDVLLFHSLCVHRATDNRTPDRVRVSVDYRYQGISQPVEGRSLLPHFNRLSWDEIYQGWDSRELRYYWTRRELTITEFTRRYHEAEGR
jgi:ectoine hydroxylase-related dioxygenase (phytanoyl-CoA dioxygenase family)